MEEWRERKIHSSTPQSDNITALLYSPRQVNVEDVLFSPRNMDHMKSIYQDTHLLEESEHAQDELESDDDSMTASSSTLAPVDSIVTSSSSLPPPVPHLPFLYEITPRLTDGSRSQNREV